MAFGTSRSKKKPDELYRTVLPVTVFSMPVVRVRAGAMSDSWVGRG